MKKIIPLIGVCAILSGCSDLAYEYESDKRVRHLIFVKCLEASAAIITENSKSNSEAHETVIRCSNEAYLQSLYRKHKDAPSRPDITEEWLRSLDAGVMKETEE